MSATDGSPPSLPRALPENTDPSDPQYGFNTDKWKANPVPAGPDWFNSDDRMRRDANAYAYQQIGNPSDWNRYINLGLFTTADGTEFDDIWAAVDDKPLQVHQAIWYNYKYHVDHEYVSSDKLNEWAMNVSLPFLQHYNPAFLDIDTMKNERGLAQYFDDDKNPDNQNEWLPVLDKRKRTKSPPLYTSVPGFNPVEDDIIRRPSATTALPAKENDKQHLSHTSKLVKLGGDRTKKNRNKAALPKAPKVSTVEEDVDEDQHMEEKTESEEADASIVTQAVPSRVVPYPRIATNDGTHRLTIQWTAPTDVAEYEKDKNKCNLAIHILVSKLLLADDGVLFRWESEDLTTTKATTSLNPTELREFITPTVTFIKSTRQMIFGVRFGFLANPKQWQFCDRTKAILKEQHLVVKMSNSASTSGKVVTAGYILFKAPNTTHRHRYTQFLRSQLPEAAPYFDLIRLKHTPMDQLIPHLAIQCGERHVTPLSHAMSNILTGQGSALFIPRYAMSAMTDEQVTQHFVFHEKWAKSLKPIPLKPYITHLDQIRTEYFDNGGTIERSTRNWASTLRLPDGTPALSDVTNGSKERHATLLIPAHYLTAATLEWRQYRSRLHPPGHREARFRDEVKDLPDQIHIQNAVESHMTFLEKMSSATVWNTVPPPVPNEGDQQKNQSAMPLPQVALAAANTVWPTITSNNKTSKKQVSQSERFGTSTWNTSGHTSLASDDSRSIDSTQNLTVSSKESQSRFKQLEDMIRRQQEQSNQESQEAKTRLCNMEIQFNRIDDLDTKVAAIQGDLSVVHNQLSTAAQNQHQLSLDLQSLQNHTSSQFAVLSSNGIAAMESQHSLSTSMLDLRSQFSQMSRLLQDLSNKLENTMTNRVAESYNPQRSRAEVSTSAAVTATEGNDGTETSVSSRRSAASETNSQTSSHISHQDSSTVSSTCSTMDETSVADLSQCPSPTKKKHRSSPVTEETTAEQEEEETSGDDEVVTVRMTRRHSMVSTNLGTRFDSVIEQESTTPLRPPHSPASPDTPNTVDTAQHTQEAPLDPQYTATGPAGADKT